MRKGVRWLVALLVMGAVAAAATAPAPPVVLVTAFKPYAGRGVNGSETVAKALAGTLIAGARVQVAVLPVVWGEPERQLPVLVESLKPVLILGLGEGWPGKIAVEQVARNLAGDLADEAGQKPPAAKLDAAGPDQRPARLAFEAAWFAHAAVPVVSSKAIGDYLCNELFYTALGTPVKLVGFIHLPPQGKMSDEDYLGKMRPVVITIVEKNLAMRK